ncbi:hypothetical protein NF867_13430 [Solitalea sp. MAHUQ-68]|uniref:Uncharacterized protein n=1 Tax=Solitalea agri TaxID=2953739 RepID=A0A9X2F430_9SPHI|nr:hypothetical protein [Solitalea agri]MCO4293865.1 hypothetical protein [Solitalea agri]
MNKAFFSRLLFCAFLLVNLQAFASGGSSAINLHGKLKIESCSTAIDSTGSKRKGDKKEGKEEDIKEVPKSRKQGKPEEIKPPVKVKPVKVAKPKPIKVNTRIH